MGYIKFVPTLNRKQKDTIYFLSWESKTKISMEQYANTKEAMGILGIRSQTIIGKYETDEKIKVYRSFNNKKRYKVSELLKIQSKK